MGIPFSALINGRAERQMGTSSFSPCHGLCPFSAAAGAAFPVSQKNPATRASRPGLHASAAGAAGLRERAANGDIQFLSVSWALPLFRRRCRGFPCLSKNIRPPGPLGPGYMPRPLARPGRGSERSDPMDRVDSAGRVRRTRPTVGSKAEADASKPARGLPITGTQ